MPYPLSEPDFNESPTRILAKIGWLLFAVVRGDKGALVRGNVGLSGSSSAVAVTPSNTVDLASTTRAIYVGGAGDVTAVVGGTAVLFKAVPVGTWLPVACTRVDSTGTTATNLVALF